MKKILSIFILISTLTPARESYEDILNLTENPELTKAYMNKQQYFKDIQEILKSKNGWTINNEKMINKKFPETNQKQFGTVSTKQMIQNKKYISVLDFGAKGDGSSDDSYAINKAILVAESNGGGIVYIPQGIYKTTKQITVKPNVVVEGAGRGETIVRLFVYDQVFILEKNSALKNITADANNTNKGQESKLAVIGIVGNNSIIDTVEVMNGYTGLVVTGAAFNLVRNIHAHHNKSRGVQLDPFAHDNIINGVYSHNNGNAGIIISHGSYNNIIKNFLIAEISNASLWLSEGAYKNKVMNGVIRDPLTEKVAINIQAGSYLNSIFNIGVFNHPSIIQIVGRKVDGVYPQVVNNDSYGNILDNIYAVGLSNINPNNYAVSFQDADGSYTARDSEIRNSYFENFYGIFHNTSDAANNTKLHNIRIKIKSIGNGGVMKGMKSNGRDIIKVSQVEGFSNKTKSERKIFTNTLLDQ